jgi:succinoglycan biosynthesis protein ExoM
VLISVCVITYQRPEGLKRLLSALNNLTFNNIEQPEIEVIIVDNDTSGSAISPCKNIQPDFKWDLKFGVESRRGISYARNRSIALVSPLSEFVAIVDDDEVPAPQWLEQLILSQKQYSADVVAGPVLPVFADGDVPSWVERGKFFDSPTHRNGEDLHIVFTNNVLVRAALLKQLDPPFAERFSFTGGEDSHLFMGLHQAGAKMIWAQDAIVEEWIPRQRTTMSYILKRAYRSWSTHSSIEREWYPSFRVQLVRLLKGLALIAIGAIRLLPSPLQREEYTVIALRYIFRGCGTISGLMGFNYEEYRRIEPSSL